MTAAPHEKFLTERKKNFGEQRADFYKKHADGVLIDDVHRAIAAKEAPDIPTLKKYLLAGNERMVRQINEFESQFWKLRDPKGTGYAKAEKDCVDSRPMSTTVLDYMEREMIHGRTAGAIVRHGRIFESLALYGVGFVKVHYGCGAEKESHDYHTGQFKGKPDEDLRRIVESIPFPVASEPNVSFRTELNGVHQVSMAAVIMERLKLGYPIYPIMYTWENWAKGQEVDVLWLSRTQRRENPLVGAMRENAKLLWKIAADLGRSPVDKEDPHKNQFAHTIFVYDPYRLGRFNDPRAGIFDLLPNEGLCVSFDFDKIVNNGGELSRSALGSVKYAGFHEEHGVYGHVVGVGGKNGNRHIQIIDPDPKVTLKVEAALLADSPIIRDLTRGGETIIRTKYDLETREVTFLD